MVESIKAARRFLAANAWKGYVLAPFGDLATADTDTKIEAYVRKHAGTVWHAVGTAMMTAKGASYGVVDPDLKVKGVDGLRIVDGSILVSPNVLIYMRRSLLLYPAFRPERAHPRSNLSHRRTRCGFDQEGLQMR